MTFFFFFLLSGPFSCHHGCSLSLPSSWFCSFWLCAGLSSPQKHVESRIGSRACSFFWTLWKGWKSIKSWMVYEADSSHAKTNSNQNRSYEHQWSCCNLTAPSVSSSCSVCDCVWLSLQRAGGNEEQQWDWIIRGPGSGNKRGPLHSFHTVKREIFETQATIDGWAYFSLRRCLFQWCHCWNRGVERKPATLPPSGDSLQTIEHQFLHVFRQVIVRKVRAPRLDGFWIEDTWIHQ